MGQTTKLDWLARNLNHPQHHLPKLMFLEVPTDLERNKTHVTKVVENTRRFAPTKPDQREIEKHQSVPVEKKK